MALQRGWLRDFLGEPEVAIEHLEHDMRLSPLDPFIFRAYAGLACAHILADRYAEASPKQPGATKGRR
jgi:adenylate cyclase